MIEGFIHDVMHSFVSNKADGFLQVLKNFTSSIAVGNPSSDNMITKLQIPRKSIRQPRIDEIVFSTT
jgi:hypothetical protein